MSRVGSPLTPTRSASMRGFTWPSWSATLRILASTPGPRRRQAVGGGGVRGPGRAAAVRPGAQRAQLRFGEGGDGAAAGPPPVVGIDLDPVRAMPDLVPHGAQDLRLAARLGRALGR